MAEIIVCGKNCDFFAGSIRRALRVCGASAEAIRIVPANLAGASDRFDALVARGEPEFCRGVRLRVLVPEGAGFAGDDRTVTCGLGSRCDLTVSSVGGGRLVLALSREIADCRGRSVEPFEWPVRGSFGSAEAILTAAALRLYFEPEAPGNPMSAPVNIWRNISGRP